MRLRRRILSAALCLALVGTEAMAVEEPAFETLLRDGAFEVRDYPALVVAEVTVSGDQEEAASRGFRLLAGYIFGGNRRRRSIAISAPLAQAPASEKIAMTAPVTQTPNANRWVVRFTMPRVYSLETLPEPSRAEVHLRVIPPTRVAILKFSGVARETNVHAKTVELEKLAERHNLRTVGPVSLAQYDPPWTPWFARRNEVMISVKH